MAGSWRCFLTHFSEDGYADSHDETFHGDFAPDMSRDGYVLEVDMTPGSEIRDFYSCVAGSRPRRIFERNILDRFDQTYDGEDFRHVRGERWARNYLSALEDVGTGVEEVRLETASEEWRREGLNAPKYKIPLQSHQMLRREITPSDIVSRGIQDGVWREARKDPAVTGSELRNYMLQL